MVLQSNVLIFLRKKIWHFIIALVLLVITAVSGYQIWLYYQAQQHIEDAKYYFAVQSMLVNEKPAGIKALQHIVNSRIGLIYQVLAQFSLAKTYIDNKQPEMACKVLVDVSSQQTVEDYIRSLALLQAAVLPTRSCDSLLLDSIIALQENSAWKYIAHFVELELILRKNSIDDIRDKIKEILKDDSTPFTFREAVSKILTVL